MDERPWRETIALDALAAPPPVLPMSRTDLSPLLTVEEAAAMLTHSESAAERGIEPGGMMWQLTDAIIALI